MTTDNSKELYIEYAPSDIERVLQSETFWKNVEYLNDIFWLKDEKIDALNICGLNTLLNKCVLISCYMENPGDRPKGLSNSIPKKDSELLIGRQKWWRYVITQAMGLVINLCDIPVNLPGEEAVNGMKNDNFFWSICWKEMIAKCILQPDLKKLFYHKNTSGKLIKQLFSIRLDEQFASKGDAYAK